MQFQITTMLPALIRHVQGRSEKRGAEHIPAITIFVQCVTSNDVLDQLSPGLRRMMYGPTTETEAQPELDGVEPVSTLPRLRSADLEPIRLKREWAGYTLTIDRGLGVEGSNLVISECAVDHIKCECKEGGTVETDIRIRASGIDQETLGAAFMMMRHEAKITLTAPAMVQDAIPTEPPKKRGRPPKTEPAPAAEPTVTEIFAAAKVVSLGEQTP